MVLLPPQTPIAPPRSKDADGKGAHSNHILGPLLAATGAHYMIQTLCYVPTLYLPQRQAGARSVGRTHFLLHLYIQIPIPGGVDSLAVALECLL